MTRTTNTSSSSRSATTRQQSESLMIVWYTMFLFGLLILMKGVDAWIPAAVVVHHHRSLWTATFPTTPTTRETTVLYADATTSVTTSSSQEEEEYEYVEYDALTEAEFVGSEWLVGTCWDQNPNKIDETWVRLVVSEDGKNLCYWGDNSEGKWALDVASQFLSISKESLFGKQIWAGIVDDFYFMQGTVRGWTYLQPASVLAQWQAKRLGVDADEAGTAPWFEEQEEQEEGSPSSSEEDEEEALN